VAIPNYVRYREKGYDAAASHDIKNAFTAAQAYFIDFETQPVNEDALASYGYRSTRFVSLSIDDATATGLSMSCSHERGTKTYTVNAAGRIRF
jgi:hypothetical protein